MFFQSLVIAAAALSAVSALPAPANHVTTSYGLPEPTAVNQAKVAASHSTTLTYTSPPSKTVSLTGVTHTVAVGRGGLKFDPDNVVAEIGDVVEWHYLPANHSVAQSSFDKPCRPLNEYAFNSDFFPTKEGQNPEVFQIVVEDKTPIWYYCAQTKGNHCQSGMVGVVNQKFDTPFTLAAHRELAAKTNVSTTLPHVQGGYRIPNPNPLSGL
ncbi:Cupredoxin [Coniochaeta ligniaria NRRL 30616]|uniref:Cupredoxin n=1 Tax=Coniochaeta ligniaria NRRL 30616 TaxID=1408157 RepID=A0A1J7JMN7_9PEZI|nr:Cupredoxin [Coniochaeta ligniaria NRRL 30616]